MGNKSLDYLKKSHQNVFDNNVGETKIQGILVFVKDPLPKNVDMRSCLQYVLERMPKTVLSGVERIMIGQFPFLQSRHVDAIFDDGIIYVSNVHENNLDFYTDVVHEIGHAFEEKNKDFLYGDGEIEREFLGKREKLFQLLDKNNLITHPITKEMFENTKYDKNFDEFLYRKIGYGLLRNFTEGLFISPYGATCIREYYGNAFENFFTNDIFLVKKYSPAVYDKLIEFLEM